MKVEFKFDKEKDMYNYWETVNYGKSYGYDFTKHLPKEIIKICKKKDFNKCRKQLLKSIKNIYKNRLLKDTPKYLQESWNKINKEYFKRLEKITKKKFPNKKINVFLTTIPRCPYRPYWSPPAFYVPIFSSIPHVLQICGHELMHIHLHNTDWWNKVEKELGNKKTHDLKESLTELLNLEFKELWIVKDEGYPNHKKLREYIHQQWKKKKDFDELTKKCIKKIK